MRVTSKGQVTIPKEVRDKLGIEPGSPIFQAADEACKHLLPSQGQGQRP